MTTGQGRVLHQGFSVRRMPTRRRRTRGAWHLHLVANFRTGTTTGSKVLRHVPPRGNPCLRRAEVHRRAVRRRVRRRTGFDAGPVGKREGPVNASGPGPWVAAMVQARPRPEASRARRASCVVQGAGVPPIASPGGAGAGPGPGDGPHNRFAGPRTAWGDEPASRASQRMPTSVMAGRPPTRPFGRQVGRGVAAKVHGDERPAPALVRRR